ETQLTDHPAAGSAAPDQGAAFDRDGDRLRDVRSPEKCEPERSCQHQPPHGILLKIAECPGRARTCARTARCVPISAVTLRIDFSATWPPDRPASRRVLADNMTARSQGLQVRAHPGRATRGAAAGLAAVRMLDGDPPAAVSFWRRRGGL